MNTEQTATRPFNYEVLAEKIKNLVEEYFFVKDSTVKSRKRNIVTARHISMYLIRKYTSLVFKEIGQMFGGRDHTTAIHACQTVETFLEVDENFKLQVDELDRFVIELMGNCRIDKVSSEDRMMILFYEWATLHKWVRVKDVWINPDDMHTHRTDFQIMQLFKGRINEKEEQLVSEGEGSKHQIDAGYPHDSHVPGCPGNATVKENVSIAV